MITNITLHKPFLCRIQSLRKSPGTQEAETLGGRERRMIRSRDRRRKVERPHPEIQTPVQSRRKTEVQLVKPLRNPTPKSPPPLNPVRRLNRVANRVPAHLNPPHFLKERTKKMELSWRNLILGSERGKVISLRLRPKMAEFPPWCSPIRASVGSPR